MELNETIDGMVSDDYKERFVAEFQQLEIRFSKLYDMLQKWDSGDLNFEPTCPRKLLLEQLSIMSKLKVIMRERAGLEGIELPK